MSKQPWWKFYSADYLLDRDVDKLPLDAQAILVRMWAVVHMDGSIPDDAEEIARLCRIRDFGAMQMHLQKLMQFFYKDASGLLRSKRMDEERERSSKTSEARKQSAEVRWNQEHKKFADANACANADANTHAVRSQSQKSDKNHKTHNDFSPTDCSRFVCEGMELSGREMTWLTTDAIERAAKKYQIEPQNAAELIVQRWNEYDTPDRPFKVGKKKFLQELMLDPEKWRKASNGYNPFAD